MKTPVFYGSSVAIVTPFTREGKVNYDKFHELVDKQIAGGTAAITVVGTTGEGSTLSDEEHLSLIQEGPAARRNFLDIAISQLRPMYLASLTRYNHILKQRNTLIREAEENRKPFDDTVEFWSAQLAHEGAALCAARLDYVHRVNASVRTCFADMTGGREEPAFHYVGAAHLEEERYADTALTEKSLFVHFYLASKLKFFNI